MLIPAAVGDTTALLGTRSAAGDSGAELSVVGMPVHLLVSCASPCFPGRSNAQARCLHHGWQSPVRPEVSRGETGGTFPGL